MRTSPWPTIASYAVSALLMIVVGIVVGGFLLILGLLGTAVCSVIACDMAIRAYHS
ncbi:hypothetical protein P9209_16415 [Prescottella defluvii]|nr:hypothetical protein P9209_16415 [Prescottella defluvii]